jgi:hypothetical protein
VHRAGVWAVQICWLITEGGDRFVDVKKLAKSMGAITMSLQFLQFTVFVFIAGIDLAVLQPHFARQFCITAIMMG